MSRDSKGVGIQRESEVKSESGIRGRLQESEATLIRE